MPGGLEGGRDRPPATEVFDFGPGLEDVANLAHLAAVEAQECTRFPRKVDCQGLSWQKFAEEDLAHLIEAGLEVTQGVHASPPKISTSRKAQTGLAWPTVITWLGSPLPQLGVPKMPKVEASPTLNRLRQKVAEMPR
jgi:hypothetical protein